MKRKHGRIATQTLATREEFSNSNLPDLWPQIVSPKSISIGRAKRVGLIVTSIEIVWLAMQSISHWMVVVGTNAPIPPITPNFITLLIQY